MSEITEEELIKLLEAIVRDIERDPSDLILSQSLYDLLEAVEGNLASLSIQLEPKWFGLIYFFKVLFWDNLFEDFVTRPISQEQGKSLFNEMVESLGQLIKEVLTGDEKVMILLGEITGIYYRLAEICEDDDSSDWIYL